MGKTIKAINDQTKIKNNVIKIPRGAYQAVVGDFLISTFISEITPEDAERILTVCNDKNRVMSQKNLHLIGRELKNNRWVFDGTPIRFDADGNLMDGQHRLTELSKLKGTDTSIKFLIIKGLDPNSFKVMDVGKKRSAGDVFSIEGVTNPDITATSVKFIDALQKGSFKIGRTAMNHGLTNHQAYEKYLELKNIDKFVTEGKMLNKHKPKLLPDATIISFWYVFNEVNSKKANDFINQLVTGVGIEKNSPVGALRDRLFRAQMNGAVKMKYIEKNRLIVSAWNKFLSGKEVDFLAIPKPTENLKIQN